ncbi:MAG: UvrD-helicase domain-containing protein [Bordetella sp.]|nr:MAG: UvrD-helicase domain-containing protein [Bordetella sp.]
MEIRNNSDQAIRIQALDSTCSFIVQAPAGSGKTELLTDRILSLLTKVDHPEEIVAITFTKKAASEMRDRVLEKLKLGLKECLSSSIHEKNSWKLAKTVLTIDKNKNWKLLQNPTRLNICTIDSFCVSLLRNMPFSSELGSMPNIIENAKAHYFSAATATLNLANKNNDVKEFLTYMDVNLSLAKETIANMLSIRDQWLNFLRYDLKKNFLENAIKEAIQEDLTNLANLMPTNLFNFICPIARSAAKNLENLTDLNDNKLSSLLYWNSPLSTNEDSLEKWKALACLLLTSKNKIRTANSVNKNIGFPINCSDKKIFLSWLEKIDPKADWIVHLGRVRDIPNSKITDSQWKILSTQLKILNLAVHQLQSIFSASKEIDFIEIIERALIGLGTLDKPSKFSKKIDISISHLLIDEFQDTSQSQKNLIERLISRWVKNDQKTIFLVGDPMQSIYRFRRAEVGLFLQILEQGIGNIRPIFLQLTNNFRSQSGIVSWINKIFINIFPDKMI